MSGEPLEVTLNARSSTRGVGLARRYVSDGWEEKGDHLINGGMSSRPGRRLLHNHRHQPLSRWILVDDMVRVVTKERSAINER